MLKLCLKQVALCAAVVLASAQGSLFAQVDSITLTRPRYEPFEHRLNDSASRIPPIPERLLFDFLNRESRVREELNQHTFRRDVLLQTIGPDGEVTGQYIRNSQIVFDDKGNRVERVLFHPRSTLKGVKISKEDIQDLAGAQLLGVDVNEASKYLLSLAGEEKIGGRTVYAIDVTPRYRPDPYRMKERFFVGRIWLDAETLQVVKIRGKVQPQGKQRFPVFETARQWVAGRFLFPSTTFGDEVVHFPDRSVHCRIKVRYYDYQRFRSTVKITEVEEPLLN